jgi:FKBP-type peptidyl-prolyl cis-trans isomerase 2
MTENEGAEKHPAKKDAKEPSGAKVEPGDIVLVEYDAWIEDTKELFDTTSESVARENDMYNEKMVYSAQPLIIGKGRLFPGLDEDMVKAEVGKEYEVIIPPEKGAGARDPKLVELHPVREFLKQEIEPRVGLEVTVKNRSGHITAVTAGRVRVDFNNKLAGRTLKYKYKVTEKPTKPKELVELILKMAYGTAEGFEIEHHGKNYKLKLPDACKYDQRWIISKYAVVRDLREVLEADTISFVEEYAKPEKKEEPAEAKVEKAAEVPEKTAEPAPEAKADAEKAPEELTEEDRKS